MNKDCLHLPFDTHCEYMWLGSSVAMRCLALSRILSFDYQNVVKYSATLFKSWTVEIPDINALFFDQFLKWSISIFITERIWATKKKSKEL